MTETTYVVWREVLDEVEVIVSILRHKCTLDQSIDRNHRVAERIRQLGRDMEAPTGPVIHEPKEEK